jgi:lipopolysaccharide/colanic/teichoic acid biosynthesis glycosyltransferase
MKLVITGAGGFVGTQLVNRLQHDPAYELLLVSRDASSLKKHFPDVAICSYDCLRVQPLEDAVILHLAVRNNDQASSEADFMAANVDHLLKTARDAKLNGAKKFINFCSTHALQVKQNNFYGHSKKQGAIKLASEWPSAAVNLYLPAVYGTQFKGKLTILNTWPLPLRVVTLSLLRLFKPVLSVDHLLAKLKELFDELPVNGDDWQTEKYCADPVPQYGVYAMLKRSLDLLAALSILTFGGWLMLLIAAYVRLDSPGSVIFAQKRVGRNGVIFTCYKFRTMATGTVEAASHEVSAAVVTKAGSFLRRTKLDELPQIFNIFRNEMSLVGPRPCLPSQHELIHQRQARGVFLIKPGITGLAQINDIDMSEPARLAAWDSRYSAFRTMLLDLSVIFRTVMGRGGGDRVNDTANAAS